VHDRRNRRSSQFQVTLLSACFILACVVSCTEKSSTDSPPRMPAEVPTAAGTNSPPKNETDREVKPSAGESAPREPELLSREEIESGWVRLFDGRTLFGWKPNSDTKWNVEHGTITADGKTPGLLMTTFELANYELRCDYRLQAGGNSGLFLRSDFAPSDPARDCYEFNMCDTHPEFPTGSLVGRKKVESAIKGDGEWHSLHITLDGPKVAAQFDGQPLIDYEDTSGSPRTIGHIGLQANGGRIEFRNIALRPLGANAIFNGKDLSGWREVPGSKSVFEAVDGSIHVTDGRGFLETEQTYANFVLQTDARTNGKHLNSGIFFRALAGTEEAPSHGYEYQIHNGYGDDDRSKPIDQGTGAIFRRASARWVVADDNDWFTMTLIANGPHFATWVNGHQVVDWTDTRPDHENPRKGRRLKAGHLSLQGHDPTTNLDFRNLRIAELGGS